MSRKEDWLRGEGIVFRVAGLIALTCAVFLIGSSFAVAETPSGNNVNPYYGSFSTEVPIAVPGFHGLEPKLKLVYNSTGRNGLTGVGWGLSGISYIERGLPGGGSPKYDANDAYFLDGSELLPSTLQGGTHCTRIQNYTRIVKDSGANKWYVYGTNGNLATYEPLYQTNKGTFRWYLTSVRDLHGNVVTYTYWTDGSSPTLDVYLSTISYNGTTIRFYLESRADTVTYATGAGMGSVRYRLKTVDVATSDYRVRAYKLNYTVSAWTSYSLLSAVQQYGKDCQTDGAGNILGGSSLPPMAFSYSPEADGTFTLGPYLHLRTSGDFGVSTWKLLSGDVNGDGKNDLIYIHTSASGNEGVSTLTFIADGSGGYIQGTIETPRPYGDLGGSDWKLNSGDVNGDGKTDIIFTYASASGNEGVYVLTLLSNGQGGFSLGPLGHPRGYGDLGTSNWKLITGDVNHDGKTDLVFTYTATSGNEGIYTQTLLADGVGGFSLGPYNHPRTTGDFGVTAWKYAQGDVNGDGNLDLIYICTSASGNEGVRTLVLLSDGAGGYNQGPLETPRTYGDLGGSNWKFNIADINGDGTSDILFIYTSAAGNEGVYTLSFFSNGSGGFSLGPYDHPLTTGDIGRNEWKINIGDVNGDGKSDIIYVYSSASGNEGAYTRVLLSDGTGTFNLSPYEHPVIVGDLGTTNWKLNIGDANGDGKTDLIFVYSSLTGNEGIYSKVLLADGSTPNLLTSLSNGIGGTTTITYTPSSAYSNTYLPVGMILQAVSSITTSDGRGNSSTVNYSYAGGLWHNGERRFLGFRKVTAVLDAQGNYTETYYYQKVGSISKPEYTYYRDNQGRIFRYSKYQYAENLTPPYTSLMTDRWEYECNLSSNCLATLLQFAYDQYGNVITTYEHGDYSVAGDERTNYRGYYPNTNSYLVGLPAYENTYSGIGTGGTLLKQVLYQYDGNSSYAAPATVGDLTTVKKWNSGTGGYVSASLTYDAYGNVTSQTDERGYTSSTAYDTAYHLYPVQACNALGHCVNTVWDAVMGQKLSVTDSNNAQLRYSYDALGRSLTETDPSGNVSTYQYLDLGNPNFQRVRKSLPDGTADGLWAETYQDGLGREYKQVKEGGFQRETIYSDTSKRVFRQSLWFASGETPRYVTYQYDGLGRQRIATNPDGSFSEVVYANDANGKPYTASYDELGHEKVAWKDAYGNLIQVREKNGGQYSYTTYEYDMAGNPTRVIDAHGNATNTVWDSLGRKLATSDADMGTWTYAYDAGGNLLSQTNAKGQTSNFAYDAIGRVTTKQYQGQTEAAYYYDEMGHGAAIGRLTRVVHPHGYESHTWDIRGQETATTRDIDGVAQSLAQSYDSLGRVATITYPDGEVLQYIYDSYGRLAGVPGYAPELTWTANGQISSLSYANGTVNEYTYSPNRKWLSTALVSGPGGTTLYDAAYTYDAAARVTTVTSTSNPLLNLAFGYDDLSRLVGVSGGQSQALSYDAIGNILSNSDKGNYAYSDPNHAHAATSAGSDVFTYDANGNMTSGGNRAFTWDHNNRLQTVTMGSTVTSFLYDQDGQRIVKQGPEHTSLYFGAMVEIVDGVLTKYYYAGPILIAKKDNTGISWYHSDHLGSIRLMTNAAGAATRLYDYASFGETVFEAGTTKNERGFTGHQRDASVGLVYMGARYYDDTLGRFISADTIVPNPANPQALNRYTYVYNNPIANVDPTGHWSVSSIFKPVKEVGRFVGKVVDEAERGVKKYSDTLVTAAFAAMTGNPVAVVASVSANITLFHTGEGRDLVEKMGEEFFDDVLGFSPRYAHMASSITLNAGLTSAYTAAYYYWDGTPSLQLGGKVTSAEDARYTDYFKNAGEGGWTAGGSNMIDLVKNGNVYELKNSLGQVVGLYGEAPAFGSGWFGDAIGLKHTAVILRNSSGRIINSMSGLAGGNLYLATSVCHQMSGQTLAKAGYSNFISGMQGSGAMSYLSHAVYGPYGSSQPLIAANRARQN